MEISVQLIKETKIGSAETMTTAEMNMENTGPESFETVIDAFFVFAGRALELPPNPEPILPPLDDPFEYSGVAGPPDYWPDSEPAEPGPFDLPAGAEQKIAEAMQQADEAQLAEAAKKMEIERRERTEAALAYTKEAQERAQKQLDAEIKEKAMKANGYSATRPRQLPVIGQENRGAFLMAELISDAVQKYTEPAEPAPVATRSERRKEAAELLPFEEGPDPHPEPVPAPPVEEEPVPDHWQTGYKIGPFGGKLYRCHIKCECGEKSRRYIPADFEVVYCRQCPGELYVERAQPGTDENGEMNRDSWGSFFNAKVMVPMEDRQHRE